MTDPDLRPEPEALLQQASREGRGRLKVFLGGAPGVGKTYAMLEAARARRAEGVDVLAAVIETHGRAETMALLRDLPQLPRREMPYRDHVLSEMDLDALLIRHPALALIDELAHSNADGSRHEKRWQDVQEVLEAGIDVYTTLNVQHIETLNDTVARITGVRVRETVPDAVLETVSEIELVDLPPEELLARLKAGKVYVPDQATRAVQNFFTKGNLTALRELAMRAAADRVDAQLREHMAANAIPGPWPAQERILVCINESPAARDAIRVAKRSADRARAEWIALSVTSTRTEALTAAEKDGIAASLRLAERLGAELVTLTAEHDVAAEILDYARRRNVRRIVLGRARPAGVLARLLRENVSRNMIRAGRDFEITLTSEAAASAPPQQMTRPALPRSINLPAHGAALAAVVIASCAAWAADALFPVASLSLVYMTAVVAVAARFGLAPALTTAAAGFAAYNFFFTEPRFTFQVSRQGEVLTLGLFLAASVLTGNLAARLRAKVNALRAISDRTNRLFEFSRRAAGAARFDDVVWATVSHVAATLDCETILLAPDMSGDLVIVGGFPPEDQIDIRDMSAARYAWDKGEVSGHGSGTLPMAKWLFLPVATANRRLGVLGVTFADLSLFAGMDRRLLDALVDQIALAIERTRLTEELSETRLVAETDRLRTALLSSVSHDLRTPLVTIIGAAGSLADAPDLPVAVRSTLADSIREEGERLDRYVQNLLDMTRLGHGALKARLGPVDLSDVIGSARYRMRGPLRDHLVRSDVPDGLGPVSADPVLTEQVIVNILDNAAKYAPPGTVIRIAATVDRAWVVLTISDQGPGIPLAEQGLIFDMFYRAESGDRQKAGTGLGLAICKGLIEAQGGSIRAEAALPDGTGTRIVITLPLAVPGSGV
jgi:two-component system, OmpR family, sensor histidine kinase KdpD